MTQEKTHSVNENNYSDRESGTYGGLMLSLREYRDRLEVHRGYKLNSKPRELDCLIIDKKDNTGPMDNDIARMFSKHNVVELKNPFEPLTVDTVWKVISYAAQYKSSGKRVNEIRAEDVTITILRASRPRKTLKLLKESGYIIKNDYPGIYYISGMADFKTQIVVSSELKGDEFVPLRIQQKSPSVEDCHLFDKKIAEKHSNEEKDYFEAVIKYGLYNYKKLVVEDNNMKTAYQEFLELHEEEDKKKMEKKMEEKMEGVAISMLKEGDSVDKIVRCVELPKKKVRELAKNLKVAAAD